MYVSIYIYIYIYSGIIINSCVNKALGFLNGLAV